MRSLVQNSSFLVLFPAKAHNEEPLPNFVLLALFGLGAASSPLSLSKIEVAAAIEGVFCGGCCYDVSIHDSGQEFVNRP